MTVGMTIRTAEGRFLERHLTGNNNKRIEAAPPCERFIDVSDAKFAKSGDLGLTGAGSLTV
jgi:hypothetical protein